MQLFTSFKTLKPVLNDLKSRNKTLGFVPTMGALHNGHLSLISIALENNDFVVVSIFINPTQFNSDEDFKKYPRTTEQDATLLSGFGKSVLVYVPEVTDVYPKGIQSEHFEFGGIEDEMEGKFRPGHFDGVGTVLKSFFNLLQPDNAYFGEKDFQQLQIVKQLAVIENLNVNIVGCPILRENSGLAMSSRNKRLNEKQLSESPLIYSVLKQVKMDFGTKNAKELVQWVCEVFKNATELSLEYFEIAEEETLKPLVEIEKNKKYRAFIAVFAGEIRLIDNIALN
ncbi:pantoate--beta-alanine ligase [uncultured Planktosalinus sp.]|uniref:pantoate--beta-alanine ligase n=1 Tax=uncultured Planktosalinus sp. TaxID=1810935 RepID=UPI0030D9B57C